MSETRDETLTIKDPDDIVRARQHVRKLAGGLGFSLLDQTKLVTATRELARNTVDHGGGGRCRIEILNESNRIGLRLTFEDRGPGIEDLELALKDGYSTSRGLGLGLGLGGAKRLADEFEIRSKPGEGTRVIIAKWK